MIGRFERFSYSISEISRLWHRIAGEEMKKYDLKGSYSVYFTTLYRFPEGLTAAQLVDLCSRDKADVSRAMSLLESKGLVCRIDPDGKTYRAPLALTEQGREIAQMVDLCSRDKADVSRAMSLLESKGLVCRLDPDGKTYRAPLALTDQGREIAQHINARAKAAVELASLGLPDEKREIFYEALELITTNLQKLSRDGIPQK